MSRGNDHREVLDMPYIILVTYSSRHNIYHDGARHVIYQKAANYILKLH